MASDRVPVPVMGGSRRAERRGRRLVLASGVLVLLVLGHQWVTNPADRLWVVVVCLAVLGVPLLLTMRQTWLDTAHGRVLDRLAGLEWGTRWDDLSVLRFRDNGLGMVLLQARGRGHLRSAYVPVAAADQLGPRSQSAAFLRLLATELERWAPDREPVVTQLREQVAHLEVFDGRLLDSPLLQRYCVRLRRR